MRRKVREKENSSKEIWQQCIKRPCNNKALDGCALFASERKISVSNHSSTEVVSLGRLHLGYEVHIYMCRYKYIYNRNSCKNLSIWKRICMCLFKCVLLLQICGFCAVVEKKECNQAREYMYAHECVYVCLFLQLRL